MTERDARQWAMFTHLSGLCHYVVPVPGAGIIVPVVLWTMKKEESDFVDEQGKEAVNFQLSILLYFIVSVILCFAIIGLFLLPVVLLFQLVATIIGAVKANDGQPMQYPMTIRFIS